MYIFIFTHVHTYIYILHTQLVPEALVAGRVIDVSPVSTVCLCIFVYVCMYVRVCVCTYIVDVSPIFTF